MTDRAADDFAFIRARLAQIEGVKRAALSRRCEACFGRGWEWEANAAWAGEWRVCSGCGNPEGRPACERTTAVPVRATPAQIEAVEKLLDTLPAVRLLTREGWIA